jgi:hypothetical protein
MLDMIDMPFSVTHMEIFILYGLWELKPMSSMLTMSRDGLSAERLIAEATVSKSRWEWLVCDAWLAPTHQGIRTNKSDGAVTTTYLGCPFDWQGIRAPTLHGRCQGVAKQPSPGSVMPAMPSNAQQCPAMLGLLAHDQLVLDQLCEARALDYVALGVRSGSGSMAAGYQRAGDPQ